jgi:hypothetical protein
MSGAPHATVSEAGTTPAMRRRARWLVPVLLLSWWASPALAAVQLPVAAAPAPAVATRAATEDTSPPGNTAPATRAGSYAARDAQSQLDQWRGGDTGGGVYIGSGVLLIALLVALFLLILR